MNTHRIKYILLPSSGILLVIGLLLLIFMQELRVYDNIDDAYPLALFTSKVVPEAMDFHDILSATVKRGYDTIYLSIDVKGNLDYIKSYRYETVYIWEVDCIDISSKRYIIILPYFPDDHVIDYKGWYMAVFDASNNKWIMPLISIDGYPVKSDSNISIEIPASIICNPLLISSARVSVMVNVDTQAHPMPDYIMDSTDSKSMQVLYPLK